VLEEIPLEDIILETDSPWLTPVPHRGKRNEPSYLIYIADKIGQIKNCSADFVKEITTQNANKLFNLI
jgi:TatD DNase family protein